MLAKLSGSPISTQISSVTAPATSNGTSVISTSVIRRSVIHSSRLITTKRIDAGVDERPHDGVAGFEDRDRSADRGRLGGEHRARKLAQIVVVVRIALRQGLDPHQAVLGLPGRDEIGRQGIEADRLRLQCGLELIEHHLSGVTKISCALLR